MQGSLLGKKKTGLDKALAIANQGDRMAKSRWTSFGHQDPDLEHLTQEGELEPPALAFTTKMVPLQYIASKRGAYLKDGADEKSDDSMIQLGDIKTASGTPRS